VPAGAVATKGVLGNACAAGYRERRGMADGGARVPEVLSAAELEGFIARNPELSARGRLVVSNEDG
jgi:hypothetical protein